MFNLFRAQNGKKQKCRKNQSIEKKNILLSLIILLSPFDEPGRSDANHICFEQIKTFL